MCIHITIVHNIFTYCIPYVQQRQCTPRQFLLEFCMYDPFQVLPHVTLGIKSGKPSLYCVVSRSNQHILKNYICQSYLTTHSLVNARWLCALSPSRCRAYIQNTYVCGMNACALSPSRRWLREQHTCILSPSRRRLSDHVYASWYFETTHGVVA